MSERYILNKEDKYAYITPTNIPDEKEWKKEESEAIEKML